MIKFFGLRILWADERDPKSYSDGVRDGIHAADLKERKTQGSNNFVRQIKTEQVKSTTTKPIEDVLVIYMKADRGLAMLKELEVSHCLMPSWGETLTSETMKMWLGTSDEYAKMSIGQVFLLPENASTMGKEYDFIACKFKLQKQYVGGHINDDSFYRHEFFNQVCADRAECVQMSKRQALTEDVCQGTWDV